MEMKVTFPGGMRVDASYHSHMVHTDQPIKAGGEDSAPAPLVLFFASIAACAGLYVLAFLRQRGIPTDDLRVSQSVHWNRETHMADEITVHIEVPPEFDEKYNAALVRAVELCDVKRHIEKPPRFDVQVSRPGFDGGDGV
jgi:putative redox protein